MPDSDKGVSLYECANAHVKGQRIYCKENHVLKGATYTRLAKGCPLVCAECQGCNVIDRIGAPLEREDRGWFNKFPGN